MNFKRPAERFKEILQAIVTHVKERPLNAAVAAITIPLGLVDVGMGIHLHKTIDLIAGGLCTSAGTLHSTLLAFPQAFRNVTELLARPHEPKFISLNLNG